MEPGASYAAGGVATPILGLAATYAAGGSGKFSRLFLGEAPYFSPVLLPNILVYLDRYALSVKAISPVSLAA
ncbi:MAG TPA: hypothetical protein VFJ58_21010 [Armatimonadota bacterium]|nr:hypothetical protein [Armatimonadota bacterium]